MARNPEILSTNQLGQEVITDLILKELLDELK